MEAATYIINFFFDAYLMVLLLRVWLQAARADFYNPFSQFVVKVTNPVVIPLRRIIPGFAGIDMATIIMAIIVACAKFAILFAISSQAIDVIPVLIFGVLFFIKQAGMLLFMVMLIMALMSWVVQSNSPIQAVFYQLTEPLLRPIRRIMPDLGGIDLSILVAFLLLNVINIAIGSVLPIWRVL